MDGERTISQRATARRQKMGAGTTLHALDGEPERIAQRFGERRRLRRPGTVSPQREYSSQLRDRLSLRAGWPTLLGGAIGDIDTPHGESQGLRATGEGQGVAGWGGQDVRHRADRHNRARRRLQRAWLAGLAISSTFSQDRFVYGFYSDANYTEQHVVRWRDCRGVGADAANVVTASSGSDCCHKGGRIAFAADGMLYATLGDEHSASAAQNTGDARGKILRSCPDGSTPSDNPFGASNPAWAYGIRNPFGIAISSAGQIAITSSGPSGDAGAPSTGYDIVILKVERGKGYQWPQCYGYSHPLASSSCPAGQSPPDYSSENSTMVPTGAAFISAAGPAQFAGHLVFCAVNGGMRIVTPGSPHATLQSGPSGCQLDVKEGPDHAVYFSDQQTIYRKGSS
jgi:glucose/arabinose dehydrogenase